MNLFRERKKTTTTYSIGAQQQNDMTIRLITKLKINGKQTKLITHYP